MITNQRINITLPITTLKAIDSVTQKGDRSGFINTAVKHYFEKKSKKNLRKALKEGALARQERDLLVAEEWFPLEEEAWQKIKKK